MTQKVVTNDEAVTGSKKVKNVKKINPPLQYMKDSVRTRLSRPRALIHRLNPQIRALKKSEVGTSWNQLEPVGTSWNQLEPYHFMKST
jgi:hypothetical protein